MCVHVGVVFMPVETDSNEVFVDAEFERIPHLFVVPYLTHYLSKLFWGIQKVLEQVFFVDILASSCQILTRMTDHDFALWTYKDVEALRLSRRREIKFFEFFFTFFDFFLFVEF